MNFIIHQIEKLIYPVLTNYAKCIVETCSERNYKVKPLRVGLQSSVRTFGSHRRASWPQQTCKGPRAVAAQWSSPPPSVLLLPWAGSPGMQSTESLAFFQREWARSSGKKTSGSNKSRSWKSKIYVEHEYLIFQLVWFALLVGLGPAGFVLFVWF